MEKLRNEIPDIVLRTTLITGFPGETEEQHKELLEFVDEMEFQRLGVFPIQQRREHPPRLWKTRYRRREAAAQG